MSVLLFSEVKEAILQLGGVPDKVLGFPRHILEDMIGSGAVDVGFRATERGLEPWAIRERPTEVPSVGACRG